MLYRNAEQLTEPEKVRLEKLPESTLVRLRDNVRLEEKEDSEEIVQTYHFDEVVFELPEGSGISTAEEVEENFADWWTYGSQPEEETPSLEERISLLEEVILAM